MKRTNPRISAHPATTILGTLLAATFLACGGSDPSGVLDDSSGSAADPSSPTQRRLPTEPIAPAEPIAEPTAPAPTEPTAPASPPPAVAVAFAAALPDGTFTPLGETLIDSSAAVYVIADWTGVSDDQSERLTLTSPEGSVYYATTIALADQTTSLVRSWALPDGTRRVAFKLLIWGTTIETYGEVGTWTAKVALVNGSITDTTTFELN